MSVRTRPAEPGSSTSAGRHGRGEFSQRVAGRCYASRMHRDIQRTLARIVERIVKRFAPEKVILFGSHARGEAGPDSDFDLLIVMQPKGRKSAQELEILKSLRAFRVPADVIVTTPVDFAWRSEIPGTIERPASLEGRVLYAKN